MIKNTAYDNLHSGLYLRWVDASYVESMTAYNHQDYGIRVELCIGITLHQCIAYNNGVDDLLLQDSETCSITSTSLGDRGLRVVGDIPLEWEHTVTSTTVNDGPVVYLFDAYIEVHDAATYGQLFIVNSSIIFINNGEFSNHSSGVVVAYSDYCVFSNVAAHNCGNGFEVIASPFCTFDHCTAFHNYWNGFELEGSSDNYFTSCIMYDQLVGIAAETSPYLTINNCDSFNNAGSGFEIIESDFLAVVNSTSYSNFNDGVSIVFSKNCTIADNYIHHSGYGVRLINCINATIDTNNIELFGGMVGLLIWESIDSYLISNNVSDAVYAGINLKESSGIYVDSNKMSECGLLVEGEDLAYWNHEIGSNTVNEKPLGVFTGIDSYTTIDANDFGQLYVNNSIHVEIYGTSFANVSAPLIIVQCENITISEVSTTNGVYGVMVVQSNSCILRNFVIETPRTAGVYLYCATNMKLDDIVVSSTIDGFLIRDSDNSSFTNCIASNASQHGFYILNSDDCIFDSNVAYYNVNGFYLWYSLRNNFTKNGVFANENGFYIRGLSDSNLFLQNEIGWNTFHNAIDDVVGNTWDNGFDTGNAWSDYVSGGYYNIYGAAGAIDGFPAKLEQLITMIEGSDDIIFWRGVSSDFIQWNVTSKYPSHYVVLINGSVYLSGVWDGITPIIIELDELTVGVYNFTLFVYSLGGHHDSDSVSVTVLDQGPTSPTTQEPTTSPSPGPEGALGPMIILGAVIVFLLVALFVRRRR
jgi:parallel beta-helix repeat protein